MEAGGVARDVHVVDAGPHPVVVVRHVSAKLGPEGKVAAQETEKLYVGRQADGEAHGVGGDNLFRDPVDRLVRPFPSISTSTTDSISSALPVASLTVWEV